MNRREGRRVRTTRGRWAAIFLLFNLLPLLLSPGALLLQHGKPPEPAGQATRLPARQGPRGQGSQLWHVLLPLAQPADLHHHHHHHHDADSPSLHLAAAASFSLSLSISLSLYLSLSLSPSFSLSQAGIHEDKSVLKRTLSHR